MEKKELSVYALTVAKTGMKMTKSLNQDGLAGLGLRGLGSVVGRSANMGNFRNFMQGFVMDRPVLDQTGLEGRYDFQLDWTPDEFQFSTLGVKAPHAPGGPASAMASAAAKSPDQPPLLHLHVQIGFRHQPDCPWRY